MRDHVIVDGVCSRYRSWRMLHADMAARGDYCPLCGCYIDTGELCIYFLNNRKLFPNVSCHAACVNGDFYDASVRIRDMYKEYTSVIEVLSGYPFFDEIGVR